MAVSLLDHIVIVVPQSTTPEQLLAQVKPFTKNFTISPGGFHTSGHTQNVLISLADGVYFELIAFTSQPDESHPWGQRTPTRIVDFALLGHPECGTEFYREGRPGGRGECKWVVTLPDREWRFGKLPFWCEDVTRRDLRVPKPPDHPSGVSEVKKITIVVKSEEKKDQMRRMYGKILGDEKLVLGTPAGGEVEIELRMAETKEEQEALKRDDAGIYQVEFNVPGIVLSNSNLG